MTTAASISGLDMLQKAAVRTAAIGAEGLIDGALRSRAPSLLVPHATVFYDHAAIGGCA